VFQLYAWREHADIQYVMYMRHVSTIAYKRLVSIKTFFFRATHVCHHFILSIISKFYFGTKIAELMMTWCQTTINQSISSCFKFWPYNYRQLKKKTHQQVILNQRIAHQQTNVRGSNYNGDKLFGLVLLLEKRLFIEFCLLSSK
jgi:hypothetical protein